MKESNHYDLNYMILLPAYGRDYKNQKDVLEDYYSNKDFILANAAGEYSRYYGKPINKENIDKIEKPNVSLKFRYNNSKRFFIFKVKKRNHEKEVM